MNMSEMKIFIRLPAVMAATGLSRTTIYEGIKAGTFPAQIQIGPRAVAWDAGAIAAWQAERLLQASASGHQPNPTASSV